MNPSSGASASASPLANEHAEVKEKLEEAQKKLAAVQLENQTLLQVTNDQSSHQNAQLMRMQHEVHCIRAQYNIILDHWDQRQIYDADIRQRLIDAEQESARQKRMIEDLQQSQIGQSTAAAGTATSLGPAGTANTSSSATSAHSPPPPPPPGAPLARPAAPPTGPGARPSPPPASSTTGSVATSPQQQHRRQASVRPSASTTVRPPASTSVRPPAGPAAAAPPMPAALPTYGHPRALASAATYKDGMDGARSVRVPTGNPAVSASAAQSASAAASAPGPTAPPAISGASAQQHGEGGGDGDGDGGNEEGQGDGQGDGQGAGQGHGQGEADLDDDEEVDDGQILFEIDPVPNLRFAPTSNPNYIRKIGSNKADEIYIATPKTGYGPGFFQALARERTAAIDAAERAGDAIEGRKGKRLTTRQVQQAVVACLVDPANRERWTFEGEWDAYEERVRDVDFDGDENALLAFVLVMGFRIWVGYLEGGELEPANFGPEDEDEVDESLNVIGLIRDGRVWNSAWRWRQASDASMRS